MNEVLKCLKERRSVRKYRSEQIKDSELEQILEAGTYAPTGMGMQSPIMVAVQDPETIAKLSKMNAAVMGVTSDPFYGAPTVIVVLADRSRGTYVEDGSLVMGNLMNAAYSIGVDSCWIHRAKEVFESEEGQALLKEWGIEGDYIGIGHCILGYRDGESSEGKAEKRELYLYCKINPQGSKRPGKPDFPRFFRLFEKNKKN